MAGPNPTTTQARAGGRPNESIQPANAQGKVVTGASAEPQPSSTWRWWAHRVLDVGEFIPGVSTVAGSVNAGLYLQEGDYESAASSGLSALPGGKLVALGGKGIKALRGIGKAGKVAEGANAARKAAKEAQGANAASKAQKEAAEAKNKDGESIKKDKKKEKETCDQTCTLHPVGLCTGAKITYDVDFTLPGVLPIEIDRSYSSDMGHDGALGRNRISALDETLTLTPGGRLLYRMGSGLTSEFDRPPPNIGAVTHDVRRSYLSLAAGQNRSLIVRDAGLRKQFERFPDGVWRLVALRDPNGNRADLRRDGAGVLSRLDRSDGFALLFENDEAGRRRAVAIRAPSGETRRVARYRYDARGNLIEARNDHRPSCRYAYDTADRLTAYDDGVRVRNTYAYDAAGRVVRVATPGGAFDHALAYEAEARATTLTFAHGSATRYTFDENHKTLTETDSLGHTRHYERNDLGTLLSETDPEGNRTVYGHDAFGNRSSATDPEGRRTAYRHDEDGRLEYLIDPAGSTWTWTYDERGNLVSAVDPLGHRTDHATNEAGLPTAIMRHDGLIERRDYDASHNLVRLVDYRGGTTLFTRDAFGRLVARTDPLGHVTRFAYEERPGADFWTPTALTRPDGVTIRREAEPHEATLMLTDGEGRRTLYRYGPFDLLEAIEDPKGGSLRFSYDAEERLVRVENQLGRHWTFTRDAAGRVVVETDFSGLTTRYAYDRADRVVEARHADGARIAYAYDRSGLLVREEAWTPGAAAPAVTRYRYDACGRLAEAVNADATVAFARDALGRVIAETQDGRVIESAYDCCGNRTERRIGGRLVSAAYDPLGALAGLAIGEHAPLRVSRDAAGREVVRESAAGFRLEQAWDAVGQLVGQSGGREPGVAGMPPGPGVERSYAWSRDFAPRVIRDARWGETAYATDAAGQVVRTRHGDGGEERFSYDASLTLVGSGRDEEGLRPWQVAPGGRVERARGPHGETIRLTYDARLRVVERRVERDGFRPKVWRYGWDAQDRLVSCTPPSGERWAYGYDAFGRRVWKRRLLDEGEEAWVRGRFPGLVLGVAAGGRSALDVWPRRPAGAREVDAAPPVVGVAYLWDGDVVAQEAALRLDGSAEWDRATSWHFAPGTFVPVAKEEADGRLRYVVTDHLGTPREVFEEDGALAWAAEYQTWGNFRKLRVMEASNDNNKEANQSKLKRRFENLYVGSLIEENEENPEIRAIIISCAIRFQGQWYDQESGTYYNRFRQYDEYIGQYLSSDPLGLIGGLRSHGYVNNPTSWIDPFGLSGNNPLLPTPTGRGAAGELRGPNIPGGSETGLSTQAGGSGIQNPAVSEAYEQVPKNKRSFYHGKCCEADALSKVANKIGAKSADDLRKITEGSEFKAFNSKGRYLPACSSCRSALDYLGIK